MPLASDVICTHPSGETLFAPPQPPPAWLVDTPGGRYYAELDLDAPVTREGQLIFFAQFLHTGGRWARLLERCPLRYHGNRGSGVCNVVGTAALSILCGHWRYAHINALRGDTLNPPLLGMARVVSGDVVRRVLNRIEEAEGLRWLAGELRASVEPVLSQPWVVDIDARRNRCTRVRRPASVGGMLHTSPTQVAAMQSDNGKTRFLDTYRWMILARALEEKLAILYRGGKITGGVFLGRGQEALSAALGTALRKGDIFAPLIRDMAGRLAFGEPVLDAARTYLGSRLGPMRGRDGNIHRGRPQVGYHAMISHLGTSVATVAGALFARRARGEEGVVGATCVGDGATSTGSFHEGLNMAAVERLPLVVVVANNQYAYSTPTSRQYACEDLVERAAGYGVPGCKIDGTDPAACIATVHEVVARARAGGGPQMVVADLLRLVGHGEHDDFHYVNHALQVSPIGRDCVEVAAGQLVAQGWAEPAQIESMREQAEAEVEQACGTAMREPLPDPGSEDWCALSTRSLAEGLRE